jgi:hypothetical protein
MINPDDIADGQVIIVLQFDIGSKLLRAARYTGGENATELHTIIDHPNCWQNLRQFINGDK